MDRDLLKSMIKDSIFTQEDVAELIGIPCQTYWWRVKNNRLLVSDLVAIADLLKLTDEQILSLLGRGDN